MASTQIRSFDITLVRSTMADGVCIFLLQIGSLAIVNADKLIIGSVLGSEKVVDFDLLSRLFLLVYGIFALALGSIWPAYGEAARRGDMAWVRNKLLQSMVFGIGLMLACGAFMYFFGGTVVRIWTRGEATQVQKSLVIATTAFFAVRALTECQSVVLNAIGVLMPQVWFLGANAILNLIVGVLLAKHYGVVGVAWSFPASALFTTMCGYPYLVRRYLSNSQESRDRRAAIGLRAAARE